MQAPAIILALALGTIAIASLAQDSDIAEQPADQEETTVTDPEESLVEVEASDDSRSDKVSDNVVGSPPAHQAEATENAWFMFWHPESRLTIRDILPFLGYLVGAIIGFCGIVFSAGRSHKLAREREEELSRNDTKALAAALAGEVLMLTSLCRHWNNYIAAISEKQQFKDVGEWVDYLRNPQPLLFEKNAGKIGDLNRVTKGTVTKVVEFYSENYRLNKYIDNTHSHFFASHRSISEFEFIARLLSLAVHFRTLTAHGIEAFAYLSLVEGGNAKPSRDEIDKAALACIDELGEDKGSMFEAAEKFETESFVPMIWKKGHGVIEEIKIEKTEER